MKKAKTFIKNNIKLVIGLIIGIIISAGGVYAAIVIQGSSVGYTDNYSLGATTVQAAIDALYNKTKLGNDSKFVEAYTYNASTCVTGNESTCVATTCYKTKSANSCPAGTIIRYKVSPGNVVTFHVMYDDASTITMQTQRNILRHEQWYTSTSSTIGPFYLRDTLAGATAGWTNVKDQTFQMGTTIFKTNAYTGCAGTTCDRNVYSDSASVTVKARMITVQEAVYLGCGFMTNKTCPVWMYNYLATSKSYGGTENDDVKVRNYATYSNTGYWTMSAYSTYSGEAYTINDKGTLTGYDNTYNATTSHHNGVRAVVVVSK